MRPGAQKAHARSPTRPSQVHTANTSHAVHATDAANTGDTSTAPQTRHAGQAARKRHTPQRERAARDRHAEQRCGAPDHGDASGGQRRSRDRRAAHGHRASRHGDTRMSPRACHHEHAVPSALADLDQRIARGVGHLRQRSPRDLNSQASAWMSKRQASRCSCRTPAGGPRRSRPRRCVRGRSPAAAP